MQCPECKSTHSRKNGHPRGKQNHILDCGHQFIDDYTAVRGYSDQVKRECLKMDVNGMGFRAIERVKGVHHTTLITWVRQVTPTECLRPADHSRGWRIGCSLIPVGYSKPLSAQKNKIWLWTAVDYFKPGILGWVLGDHSGKTFAPLWAIAGADLPVRGGMALLFLRYRRLVSLSLLDSRWRLDCQQDLHDASGRGKHPVTP